MGFDSSHVIAALKATDNNVERAIDWVMSHVPEDNNLNESKERDGDGSKNLLNILILLFRINKSYFWFLLFINLFLFYRIQIDIFHISYGLFFVGWTLCVSY